MAYYINKLNQKIAYKHIKGANPGLIFVHGLNSDMMGTKALSIQKYAKKNNLSYLRFDCRGHGKSSGKFEDFTISDWKRDLIDLIDNLTKGPQIIIGSSMGGWLMMLATKARKKRICGLIGLAAAPDFGDELFSILSKKSKKEIKTNGYTNHFWNYGFSYVLTKKFFIDAKKNKVLNKTFNYFKPMVLIHGLKDEVVNSSVTKKIMKITKSKNIEIRYLKYSDHRLSSPSDLSSIFNAIDYVRNIKRLKLY